MYLHIISMAPVSIIILAHCLAEAILLKACEIVWVEYR